MSPALSPTAVSSFTPRPSTIQKVPHSHKDGGLHGASAWYPAGKPGCAAPAVPEALGQTPTWDQVRARDSKPVPSPCHSTGSEVPLRKVSGRDLGFELNSCSLAGRPHQSLLHPRLQALQLENGQLGVAGNRGIPGTPESRPPSTAPSPPGRHP